MHCLRFQSAFLFAVATGFQPSLSSLPIISKSIPSPTTLKMTQSQSSSQSSPHPATQHPGPFPHLCVFDLDACFWDQEMYTLSNIPDSSHIITGDLQGRGDGVVGVLSGRTRISLHKGSLLALQAHHDNCYGEMKVCFASSADTPLAEKIGRAALKLLEVVPGTTVWDLVVGRDWDGKDVNQIGRQPPLSSNKSQTHFPILRDVTGVRYDRMLFFDDCGWGDHCGMVEKACREEGGSGVVTVRTPYGLGEKEWMEGLNKYAKFNQE